MRCCSICKKKYYKGNGNLFRVPIDVDERLKWSKICGINFAASALICADHFLSSAIVKVGKKVALLSNAKPFVKQFKEADFSPKIEKTGCLDEVNKTVSTLGDGLLWSVPNVNNANLCTLEAAQLNRKHYKSKEATTDFRKNVAASIDLENISLENRREQFTQDLLIPNNNADLPQLHHESITQVPVIKSVFCTGFTQTNMRLCGLVEVSDFADEFRFNCFYCRRVYPLYQWQNFINHLRKEHIQNEKAFKIFKYVSNEHDYTSICSPPSIPAENDVETFVFNAESMQPVFVKQLEPANYQIECTVSDSTFDCTSKSDENTDILNNFVGIDTSIISCPIRGIKNKLRCFNKKSSTFSCFKNLKNRSTKSRNFSKSGMNDKSKQTPKKTALSRCLKRTDVEVLIPEGNGSELNGKIEYKSLSIENLQQKSTEIAFEYTPRDIVFLLLDSMKNYPVLWQFDKHPFNEDVYKAVENLCKIINNKWSLNIDNLKMRRSVNRILRFYCYLYPNTNVENVDQFTCYYDKCAEFLPLSASEIAYARCSHCYVCFKNDYHLKHHLLEEQKYLQRPFKCIECKECFRESDEYEFHKLLPHYDEIFRCEPCNKKFLRRNIYNKHIAEYHPNTKTKYKCDLCSKAYQSKTSLRNHKIVHGERKFKCHLCPKSYFVNAELRLHLKSHRKELDFICEVCGKAFLVQTSLRQHMRMHTGAKVTCNICNLKLRKSSLSRHLRVVHVAYEGTIEATFRAKNYHYNRFVQSNPIRQRAKARERKYRCKICNINFENYKLIVEHNRELHHTNVTKWPCKMCTTEFSQKLNLKRHYRKKHNLQAIQVYKLVDKNEDLNGVLDMKTEHLNKLDESISGAKKEPTENECTQIIKSELSNHSIYFEDEKIHSPTAQDEIFNNSEDNIATQEIKLEFMSDFFTDLLKEHQKNI